MKGEKVDCSARLAKGRGRREIPSPANGVRSPFPGKKVTRSRPSASAAKKGREEITPPQKWSRGGGKEKGRLLNSILSWRGKEREALNRINLSEGVVSAAMRARGAKKGFRHLRFEKRKKKKRGAVALSRVQEVPSKILQEPKEGGKEGGGAFNYELTARKFAGKIFSC